VRKLFWLTSVASAALLLAGASGAGTRNVGRVEPRQIAVHSLVAESGNRAIRLEGNGATDLDCYVYDRVGALVGYDNGTSDLCQVRLRLRAASILATASCTLFSPKSTCPASAAAWM